MNDIIGSVFKPFYLPCHLHRQIENDVLIQKDDQGFNVQRIYGIVGQLLMLYRPIAKPLSIGMGGLRVATHLVGCNQARQSGEGWKLAAESAQFGLAAISMASSFDYLPRGVFLTTGVDIVKNIGAIIYFYRQQNYDLLTEELLQLTGSSFYMAYMLSSSYYVLFASLVVQGLINFYHARKAWNEGKNPEAFTQFIVASVRCHEAKQQWNVIQQQNAFYAMQEAEGQKILKKLNELKADIEAHDKLKTTPVASKQPVITNTQEDSVNSSKQGLQGSGCINVGLLRLLPRGTLKYFLDQTQNGALRTGVQLGLSICTTNNEPLDPRLQILANAVNEKKINKRLNSFPLQNFQNVNNHAVLLEDAQGKKHNLGAHVHGFGKDLVKGANLCFRDKTRENEEIVELGFKVNHVYRGHLEESISCLFNKNTRLQMRVLSHLTGSSVKTIKVTEGKFEMGGFREQKMYHLDFGASGSILVGSDPEVAGMYNRVFVRIPKKGNLFQLHEMLSFAGLENALKRFTPVDLERLKIGYLFRHFHPEQATIFERTSQFFKLPIGQLKAAIIEQVPAMKDRFVQYLPKFRPYEILPGRIRYGVEGIGRRCYELGARSLISSVWIGSNEEESFNKVSSIVKMGMLSSELRLGNEINSVGISPNSDLGHGSADSVFMQLVTVNDYQNNEAPTMRKFGYFYPDDSIAFEFDLDVLDTLSHQYHTDKYGTRNLVLKFSTYLERPNVYDFVTEEVNGYYRGHEVMIRDRVPPSFITSILVANNEIRVRLCQYFKEAGLIQPNRDGIDTILGIPVNQFIRTPSDANMA